MYSSHLFMEAMKKFNERKEKHKLQDEARDGAS
jgi:hypothetical protein